MHKSPNQSSAGPTSSSYPHMNKVSARFLVLNEHCVNLVSRNHATIFIFAVDKYCKVTVVSSQFVKLKQLYSFRDRAFLQLQFAVHHFTNTKRC